MKLKIPLVLTALAAALSLPAGPASAQPCRGPATLAARTLPVTPAAEQALALALVGPDGEYAVQAEYEAVVQKFGQVQPYAAIINSEQCHINALKRHFEMRGLAVPENPYAGKVQAPATLKEAAERGASLEQRNVAMYELLLEQVKDQPDLVRVFGNLQSASREHHLPAFQAAAANDGQLAAGQFTCGLGMGMGRGAGQGRGGPPAWAGGAGCGAGQGGGCCGACLLGGTSQGTGKTVPGKGRGRRSGAGAGFQGGR